MNHVWKTSGEAIGLISALEIKNHRLETNLQSMDNIPTKVSALEDTIQRLMNHCSEEIETRFRDQIDHFENLISHGMQKRIQQHMENIEKLATAEVFKTNEGLTKQFMTDLHFGTHKQCDGHERKEGDHSCCCNYCTETCAQLEDEVNNRSWELTEHKTEFNYLQTFSDGLGKLFNTINDQMGIMKMDIQMLKDTESESEFESATSDSPGKDRRKKSPGDVPGVTVDALTELQTKIDDLGDEFRMEFQSRFEEGGMKLERRIIRVSEKLANEQENIQGKFEALQITVLDDQEEIRSRLGKGRTHEPLSKFHEVVKATHKQVKEDQVQIRGDMYTLECKIESKIDAITKELEQGRKATTNPRTFGMFNIPDIPDIGATTPPKKGTGATHVNTSTGKIKMTMTHYLTCLLSV